MVGFCLAGCSKDNQVQANTTSSCNFSLESGASFCPANTRPTGFTATCDKASSDDESECLATTLNDCFVNCTPARCGDGFLDNGEECDNGEENGSGEGCDTTCHLTKGVACGTNGDLRCAPDQSEVQVCVDNLWQSKSACTEDQTCNEASKQCEFVSDYCETAGDEECVGDFGRRLCGDDHRWLEDACPSSAPKCNSSKAGVQCVADEDASVSANFRINRTQLTIGGIYGFAETGKHRAQLGPVRK